MNLKAECEVSLPDEYYDIDNLKKIKGSTDLVNYIDGNDIDVVNSDDQIVPMGGGAPVKYDYRVVYHKAVTKSTGFKYASGLSGGYKGASYLYYATSGGSKYTFGVSLPTPWLPVSISVSRGRAASSDIGMALKTTSKSKYNRVMANKKYKVTPYSSQRKKKSGGKWQTYSRGSKTKYVSVSAKCVEVK